MKFLDSVRERRERREGHDGHDGHGGQQDQGQNSESGANANPQPESTFEEVRIAIEEFKKDAQAAKNGLSALVSGEGLGLRVTLQDEQGAIIRQLTGEEFLRLRAASKRSEAPRGKILDQKL